MEFDRAKYNREYQKSNIKPIKISVSPAEAEAFDAFCKDIGETKAGLLKRLVNAEAKKQGWPDIFDSKRRV